MAYLNFTELFMFRIASNKTAQLLVYLYLWYIKSN